MKIIMYEDDVRKNNPDFIYNHGSFSTIILNINKELHKLGLLAKNEIDADIVGFSSGLKLDFGFNDKKRFLIGVNETNIIPDYIVNERKRLETAGNYKYFGLSKQISDIWNTNYNSPTETIDIGVDTEFWKRQKPRLTNDIFTIISVTAGNFRSGLPYLISACDSIASMGNRIKLIIKDTDERNTKLRDIINSIYKPRFDIYYICQRWDDQKVRDFYEYADLLVYSPINTSAGIPILESAAMELPCLVPDYCPTNIYPTSELIETKQISIKSIKNVMCNIWSLPYTFLPLDESKAMMHEPDLDSMIENILKIKNNYDFYVKKAGENRKLIEENWTWKNSTNKLVKLLNTF